MRRLSNMQLGLFTDRVEVISYTGKHYSSLHEKILWTKRAIVIENIVVPIANAGQTSIFSARKIDKYLRPFLHPDKKVNEFAMMRHQWHSEDGIQKYSWVMVAVMIAIYLGITFDEWQGWLNELIDLS